ncbi:receptor-type tyrosine-protein phosphatase mu-like [Saccostrea echinata]|uniref:receptor-type tyrosine-protein phosphatase mu-like n=1 Tax=Saccostrea echinata TaxID=191078 RepID=UPI002A81AFE1|nr:receptor-type tyrosine-protein phosphatase mu-like [Saccostrea echinata]
MPLEMNNMFSENIVQKYHQRFKGGRNDVYENKRTGRLLKVDDYNLALRKPTWQANDYSTTWGADKAVDGNYSDRGALGNQCTISGDFQKTAEWRVDLERVVSISYINIYYRTDNNPGSYSNRFAGFYLYVSNTTSKENGILCFHEIQNVSGTPTEDQRINCSVYGRYVIYYNERRPGVTYPSYYSENAFNELCEVEVYGCPDSKYYGKYCDQPCPENCYDQRCNISTGNCFECKPGYKGSRCNQKCDGRMYGTACSQKCGHCLGNTQCHHINGSCSGGCSAGYEGSLCQKQCDGGKFGLRCNKTCGHCLNGAHCHHINGSCLGGCSPGYKGSLCINKCEGGMYGASCGEECGHCLNNTHCHHINGSCLDGCSPGYKGSQCKEKCSSGMYGYDCNETCGHCFDDAQCLHINGTCLQGCSAGYKGVLCTEECEGGLYGYKCNQTCGHCLNGSHCHHINGTCLNGCSIGYKRPLCTDECDGRMYGANCDVRCGHCIDDEQCDYISGTCLGGCAIGYEGLLCIRECDNGKYGENCTKRCGNCRNGSPCHHMNGTCLAGGCADGFVGSFCSQSLQNQDNTLSIAVGAIAAIVVVLVIVVLFVIFQRRSRASKASDKEKIKSSTEINTSSISTTPKEGKMGFTDIYENMKGTSQFKEKKTATKNSKNEGQELKTGTNERDEDIDNDEKLHEENPYGDFYINEETIPDINVEHLEHTIKEKRQNEDDGFKREYATMPYGEKYPCNAGKQPENVPKNRFKTTFPYDHSRIKLTNGQSDYINANYIDGIDKPNEYIAAQGPRQNTVTDYWYMIWQESVNQIIMLTNLKEGNKAKCVKYWPDLYQTTTIGVISLRAEEEQSYANYKIRKFRVTHKKLNKSRIVTQYHYTAWPDHGTPEPLCLVVFHDHVTRTKDKSNGGPTLVHCSAGIGRTGTYIAIDALYKAGKRDRKVNIAEYVKKMRENRMNMVQTYEQYMTIFLALDAMFRAPTYVYNKPDLLRKAELLSRDKPANESDLRKEFQNLLRVRPTYTEADYKFALQSAGNKSAVLPLDKYSLYLSSSVPKRGNYINAVTLPSYTKNKAFIVTYYPPPEDAVDFLRLLTDHESDVVICMDPLNKVESTKKWLPAANSVKTVSPFTVNCGQEQVTEIKCTTISITQDGTNEQRSSVSIVEPKGGLKTTEGTQATAQMLRLVTFALQSETEGPITIVSSDGAVLCGVFCAVYNTLQQLSMDGEVDIFSTVRQLQIRRPELCSSMEEYMMIYNVVLDYIRAQEETEENIYSNQ